MNRPNPPGATGENDPLLRRYHEANALDAARPAPELRAAVLAQARAHTSRPGQDSSRDRPAANDPQWRWRALGSLAVLGLVGLLVLQFDRGSETERDTALGHSSPGKAAPAAPAENAPLAPRGPGLPVQVAPPGGVATGSAPPPPARTAPSTPEPAPPARSARPVPAPTRSEAPASPSPRLEATRPPAAQSRHPAEPGAPRAAPDPFPDGQNVSGTARAGAEPEALATPAPGAPRARSDALSGGRTEQADAQARSAAPALAPMPERSAPADAAPRIADVASAADRALLLAVGQGRIEDTRTALAQGGRANATQGNGRSALMLAAMRGEPALVRLLLEAGADASRTDRDGQTAADLAERAGHHATATLLRATPAR